MGKYEPLPYDPTKAMWLREKDAKFSKITMYDGLAPTRVVREWNCQADQLAIFPERLDFTADGDGRIVLKELVGTQNVARYCINPQVSHKQLPGLWVGNQIEVSRRQLNSGEEICVLTQALTRVHCAGHGAQYNEESHRVEVVWENEQPEESTKWYDADGKVPWHSAKELLKNLRCTSRTIKKPSILFKENFPEEWVIELTWRDFSIESRSALESLTKEELVEIAFAHKIVVERAIEGLVEHNAETNTLIFKMVLQRKQVYEASTIEEFLQLPYRIKLIERDTVNAHEWSPYQYGEGYMVSCSIWFENIKDTDAQRNMLAFPDDDVVLSNLMGTNNVDDYPPGVNGTIRDWAFEYSSWWRIVKYRLEEQEDGLLVFKVDLQHPSWANTFGDDASVTNLGVVDELGDGYTEIIPGVPNSRKDLVDPEPKDGRFVRTSKQVQVTQSGEAKISAQFQRQFTYTDLHGELHRFSDGTETEYVKDFPKGTVDYDGFSATEISVNKPHNVSVDNTYRTPSTGDNHSAVDVSNLQSVKSCNNRATARIVYTNVKREAVAKLLKLAKEDMRVNGYMVTNVNQATNPQGLVTIVVSGANSEPYSYSYSYTVKRNNKTGTVTVIKMFNQPNIVDVAKSDYEGFVISGYEVEPNWNLNELCLYDGTITISPDWKKDGGWLYAFDERTWKEHETIEENSTVWPAEQSTGTVYPENGRYFVRTVYIEYNCYLSDDSDQATSFFKRNGGEEKPGSTCQTLNNGKAFLVRVANRTEGEWK